MNNEDWALKMIPVLVRWAQVAWDKPHYYSDLAAAVGFNSNRVGNILITIHGIIDALHKKEGKNIPTLNCLVSQKDSVLPGKGLGCVIKDYNSLPSKDKKKIVSQANLKAHNYDWGWVLDALKLQPAKIFTSDELSKIALSNHGLGGECKEHKAIKEYIYSHPDSIGLEEIHSAKTEYNLPSGDRLDVFFECNNNIHVAVEVKPSSSNEYDVTRGIFQCVKYQAVMDATRIADAGTYKNNVILVIAGDMSNKNRQLANELSIKFIDNFNIENHKNNHK